MDYFGTMDDGSEFYDAAQWPSVASNPVQTAPTAITETASPDWLSTIRDLGTSYLSYEQQKTMQEINIERARQGLPPLNPANYGYGVNVGLSPDTQKLLIYGGVAVVAFLIFKEMNRGRR